MNSLRNLIERISISYEKVLPVLTKLSNNNLAVKYAILKAPWNVLCGVKAKGSSMPKMKSNETKIDLIQNENKLNQNEIIVFSKYRRIAIGHGYHDLLK